ncbi:hypothetical protein [Cellulomonas sp. URHD0024]|uniref:hypothetical protein n=1 Tax=Cellulomonas sp. URHD0024 TaxID=1302620 RepID=UPI000405CAA4|nr:hypothetical protein [Cellulomonas sp. URHD0024]
MKRPNLLALPFAAVLVVALSACGGAAADEPSAPPSAAPAAASAAPSQTPTPTPTATADEVTAKTLFPRLDAALAAVQSYDLTMATTGPAPVQLAGSADLADGRKNFAASTNGAEIRLVNGILYVRLGERTRGKFVKITPDDTSNPLAAEFSGFRDDVLRSGYVGMEGAITSIASNGAHEDVNGVVATAYTVVLDTSLLTPDAAASLPTDPAAPLPARVRCTFWLDDRNLPVRTVLDVGASTTTTDISNVGLGTPVVAPPAAQVTTVMPSLG